MSCKHVQFKQKKSMQIVSVLYRWNSLLFASQKAEFYNQKFFFMIFADVEDLLKTGLITPPSSFKGSPVPSPPGSYEFDSAESPGSDSDSQMSDSGSVGGMADKSRFALCVFMFSILAFNPFGSMLGSIGSSAGGSYGGSNRGGRTLLELNGKNIHVYNVHVYNSIIEIYDFGKKNQKNICTIFCQILCSYYISVIYIFDYSYIMRRCENVCNSIMSLFDNTSFVFENSLKEEIKTFNLNEFQLT